jgi:hypothetical protein
MNSVKFGSIKLTTSIPMEPPKSTFFFAMGFSGFGCGICVGINVVSNGNHTSRSICAYKSCLLKCLDAYNIDCLQIHSLLTITNTVVIVDIGL